MWNRPLGKGKCVAAGALHTTHHGKMRPHNDLNPRSFHLGHFCDLYGLLLEEQCLLEEQRNNSVDPIMSTVNFKHGLLNVNS